ncbi:MAG: TIM barrel protein [Phycisphaerales bacterium]|nr:TIM barrel protein [Phycisphaerales bacterium]
MPGDRSLTVWLDSYRRDLKSSISAAAAHGFAAIQPNVVTAGELSSESLSTSARRHLSRFLRDLGLGIDALAAAFPGAGLTEPGDADRRLAELRRTVELAREMGVGRALVTVGQAGSGTAPAGLAEQMIRETADLADRAGVEVAVLPVGGADAAIRELIQGIGCPALRLAVDTTAIRSDSSYGWTDLAGCVHLRDGRWAGESVEEVEIGRGDVDFRALLARLSRLDRPPPSLVVRQDRPGPVDALRAGREYISSLISAGGR